jgi:excisionase family DNA binding protein
MEQHQYMTVAQLSKMSKLSENYLRTQTRNGELAHIRLGRAIRIAATDFEAFMDARRVGGEPLETAASRSSSASGTRPLVLEAV